MLYPETSSDTLHRYKVDSRGLAVATKLQGLLARQNLNLPLPKNPTQTQLYSGERQVRLA